MSYHIVYDPVTGKIIEQYEQDEVMDQSQTLYELGIIHERERIIKLILDYSFESGYDWHNDIIQLIKGENK